MACFHTQEVRPLFAHCVDIEPEPGGPSPTVFEAASLTDSFPCNSGGAKGICGCESYESSEGIWGMAEVKMWRFHNKHRILVDF